MPVSDFLSVHCFAPARSRFAFFSKPKCCADGQLRNLIPRLNKPRFAFAAAKSAWLCVERGECARWQLLVHLPAAWQRECQPPAAELASTSLSPSSPHLCQRRSKLPSQPLLVSSQLEAGVRGGLEERRERSSASR